MATATNRRTAVKDFVKRWTGRGDEIGEYQIFWIDLVQTLFGVPDGTKYFEFQKRVSMEHTKFIDAYIPSTKVLIEQKSIGIDLSVPNRQSGDKFLTPYEQAKQYAGWMKKSEQPDYIVTCNFEEFRIYDMEYPKADPIIIKLENLERSYGSLLFLLEKGTPPHPTEEEISFEAGKIVGELYDAFAKEYKEPNSEETLHSLNVLCVRLVFCLYAEDADIFERDLFYRYMAGWDTAHMRQALIALFKVLDTPPEERSPYEPNLNAFPYVNGGLFSDENIVIPAFTEEIRELLLERGSAGFDWAGISPTIFGAVFESTLNPETRRKGGMHYTSIENIHKVIDPLFLDDLEKEFTDICKITVRRTQKTKLMEFQKKLASLTFLDPACGSGNFLTETYLSLRRLENDVLRELSQGQISFGDENWSPIQVSISQFYGIEINDFAVTVAKTALWIAESQMMEETKNIVIMNEDFLPLKTNACIVEGNALRMDWESVIPKSRLSYIMGNPPFVGYSLQSAAQKNDILSVYVDKDGSTYRTAGKIDYVAAWFFKASQLISGSRIRVAFVATNSITQGEQVASVWKPLYERFNVHIDFAYRTFRWDSESNLMAHVHCVIIGFSTAMNTKLRLLYEGGQCKQVENVNAYLTDAPDIFISSRTKPLCNVLKMATGNRPADGGHLIIEEGDYDDFIRREPRVIPYIRKLTGATEFINNKKRWCLWLVGVSPAELRRMPLVLERVELCKKDRLDNGAADRQRLAETPSLFRETKNPDTAIIVPCTSSERRRYIPFGFIGKETILTNSAVCIPNATLYDFGILTSNVHMAWMRAVAGRLEMRYRYSKDIVYNNFPWPNPTGAQKAKIEETAKAILDARALYPDSSLADLYDELTMPEELRRAHRQNDIAVMEAYGFKKGMPEFSSESACVAALMKMYQKLTAAKE